MDIIEPNELIKARYKILHPDYAAFIASDFTNESAKILGRKVGLTGNGIDVLDNAFGLFLAFFLTFDQMIDFITRECMVSKSQASELSYAMLASLPDAFASAHAYAHTIVNNTVHPLEEDDSLQKEIAEAEADMQATSTSVTSNPATEQTYRSSQTDILDNNQSGNPRQ